MNGLKLIHSETAIPPQFALQFPPSADETFVVAMVDLDAPTPQMPTNAQIRHFLGGNFNFASPAGSGPVLLTNSTPALSEFRQPTPPAGSDPHRHVLFVLFVAVNVQLISEIQLCFLAV